MSVYLSEEEQIEQIKSWWKKHGNLLLMGLLAVAVIFSGWRWWQQSHRASLQQASSAYEQLLVEVANENVADIEVRADNLISTYADTIYANMATLLLAQQAVYSGDLTTAARYLQGAIKQIKNNSLRQMIRIRAARVLLADEQAESALAIIQPVNDEVFLPLVEQMRGDVYAYQQEYDAARQAYRRALDVAPQSSVAGRILQMKLNNLSSE